MAAIIDNLKTDDGDILYPITRADAVVGPDGKTTFQEQLDELSNDLGKINILNNPHTNFTTFIDGGLYKVGKEYTSKQEIKNHFDYYGTVSYWCVPYTCMTWYNDIYNSICLDVVYPTSNNGIVIEKIILGVNRTDTNKFKILNSSGCVIQNDNVVNSWNHNGENGETAFEVHLSLFGRKSIMNVN